MKSLYALCNDFMMKKRFLIFVSNNVEQQGNTNAFYMKQYEHRINF